MDCGTANNYMTAIRTYKISNDCVLFKPKRRSKSSRVRRTGSTGSRSTRYSIGEITTCMVDFFLKLMRCICCT